MEKMRLKKSSIGCVVMIMGGLLLCSCGRRNERVPLFVTEHNISEDYLIFTDDNKYMYVISRHELYFSNNDWIAYRNETLLPYPKLYVYERPHDMKTIPVLPVVLTNEQMFASWTKQDASSSVNSEVSYK